MPIVVQPVELADFDIIASHKFFNGGDLIAPLVDHTWHVEEGTPTSEADAAARTAWSAEQQKRMFLEDKTARFVKAVDTDTNEILSLARWHSYQTSWPALHTDGELERNGIGRDAEEHWPPGMNVKLHRYMLDPLLEARKSWTVPGPQWVLTTLKTRSGYRRKGAGGLLVEWGAEQAKKDGVPAYIEASADGVPVYKRCGFKVVGDYPVDLNPHGIPAVFVIKRMAANSDLPAIE